MYGAEYLKEYLKVFSGSLESNHFASANLKKEAKKRGVSSSRLVFASRKPVSEHLARHKLADLTLDTFYYNAHTTGSDSLEWSAHCNKNRKKFSRAGRREFAVSSRVGRINNA